MRFGRNILSDLNFLKRVLSHPRIPNCLYLGYTGYGNLGDEALKEAIFCLLGTKLNISSSRGFLIRLLEKIGVLHFRYLLLGGGTFLLRSEKVLNQLNNSDIAKRAVFGTGVANHEFWKDVPGSYGDFPKWQKTIDSLQYIGVRGPISQKLLTNIGVTRNVPVIGDPVLYFTRELTQPKVREKKLGINIGTAQGGKDKDLLWGRQEKVWLDNFAEFIRIMVDAGWEIEVIPVNAEDLEVIDYALSKSGYKNKIKIFQEFTSVQSTLDRLETFDVFIGQKLHSVVLSYCANTPAVMVEYRPKCRDFMHSIDMADFIIRCDKFNAARAREKIETLYNALETYRSKNNYLCLQYREKLKTSSNELLYCFLESQ